MLFIYSITDSDFQAEISGMKDCAVRDAVALVRFFAWLEKEMKEGRAGNYDEVDVSDKLLEFRRWSIWSECNLTFFRQVPGFVSESFGTISSVGSNAAIIHYHPHKPTAAKLDRDQIYLCDR